MTTKSHIRESGADDIEPINALYPAAFPDEDLLPLVNDLLRESTGVLSLVATAGATLAGHIAFTRCHGADSKGKGALLAPLAVAPDFQRQRIGSRLIAEGLKRLEADGVTQVLVLGDPNYYRRSGFAAEGSVLPPYEMPPEWAGAWQSLRLGSGDALGAGKLELPPLWMQPALWLP